MLVNFYNKLYTEIDFLKLTTDDIDELNNLLDIEPSEEEDKYEVLFKNLEEIKKNERASSIVANKILAGQTAIKWFKYDYVDEFSKEHLKRLLHSSEIGFDGSAIERLKDNIKNDIVSIVFHENIYTIKVVISDGYKRYNNGIEYRREANLKSIIVNIDIENCWIEIRGNADNCIKVENILKKRLGFINLKSVRILNKYQENINSFKNDLYNGFYLKSKVAPLQNIELTEEDGEALAKIIQIVDEYFENRDSQVLLQKLEQLDYETDGLSLSSILLAGVDNLGLKIKNDSIQDMSSQSLYTILKNDFIEDTSYIRFSLPHRFQQYTMQIGLMSNSIVFKSSVTEEVIEYVRNKIL
ncbi:hypothetical protein LTX14_000808 [Clostridium perfringens]|uniref:hypothetical protein n=1 Tax=Clostridium perfringens TaxID=1502 RepID=UPI0013E2FE9B|nr:hypothetical protein [Clostridium perfringens]MBI6022843.1 hypothetical protein [Clostridium perfringens]MBI6043627.1 hypothetical protein [Clostridium perfringens]MBI6046047.1 hypothetical protein [Clostridium perfringens]MDJ8925862.1 hypothetical protein [Clostridium perfringens]MDJ8928701.1 hypothetical protein [Clostridium perfringens]